MKNAQFRSPGKDTRTLFSFLLTITGVFFSVFAFADSLPAVPLDTAAAMDTASKFVPIPEEKIMGVSATLFWTYLAMGVGLIVVVAFAYVTSVSKDKKGPARKK